jgi:hypothetical protein
MKEEEKSNHNNGGDKWYSEYGNPENRHIVFMMA